MFSHGDGSRKSDVVPKLQYLASQVRHGNAAATPQRLSVSHRWNTTASVGHFASFLDLLSFTKEKETFWQVQGPRMKMQCLFLRQRKVNFGDGHSLRVAS